MVSWQSALVAGTSKKITGVRPSRRITSSLRPATFLLSTQLAASRSTFSMYPLAAQSASNIGLFAGMAMYWVSAGTISSSQTREANSPRALA
jgi:hypothetical protein